MITELDGWALAAAIGGKLAFVLLLVFSFAPLLVWAERRQSAMIQDRIGPTRANYQMSGFLTRWTARMLAGGKWFVVVLAALCALAAAAAVVLWLGVRAEMTWPGEAAEALSLPGGLASLPTWFWLGLLLAAVNVGLFAALRMACRRFDGNVTLFGLIHPIADAMKFLYKEDFVPPKADKLLHAFAPILVVTTAIAAFAVIPFADTLYPEWAATVLPQDGFIEGVRVPMQVASANVGILFVFAVAGTGVIGAALAGYASDNKYALLGGIRAAGQMVSYEVTLGLTLVPAFMIYGTLLLEDMVARQASHVWGLFMFPVMTLAFVLFFVCSIAESKRIPFDVPEGESELAAGYLTEYSGLKFGMFFMGEFVEVVLLSALASTIFLGGYDVPFLFRSGFEVDLGWLGAGVYAAQIPHWGVVALQVVAFVAKLAGFVWLQLMIRWTLPRFRYDQIMSLCWKYILPISLLNIMVTGVAILIWPW